ncbi:MAG: LacI family DNA-binding transcriptional regulator [Methylobacteriaceae bacterium]|nr:LacI family DNA-binding transcriptional regulator [Methylobacteriaceae bacterium]
MSKGGVTSSDVAKLAKVSQSAVSRAFSPGASVSAATRKKVLKAAEKLGYRPNALARAMISGRSGLIAVVVAYLDNQFYPVLIEHLSRALQEKGYQVLLFMTDPGDQDTLVQKVLQFQVEAIIMASATLSSSLAGECAKTGTPVLLLNRYVPSAPTSSVTSDNLEGGRLLAHFLVDGGHRRIAFIAGNEDSSTSRDREAGFYRGLAERGVVLWRRAVGGYTFEGAARAARTLFASGDRPDAVFVANDHMAFAVIDVLRAEFALTIPDDVSIVAYDDVPEAGWGGYRLTTVAQSAADMVAATVDILMAQIDRRAVQPRAAMIPARLVIRDSARIPPGRTREPGR